MDGTQQQNGPGHDWGGYVAIEPPPPPGVFKVGLVLAGAVSAGAYTAGVIDFLIETLDAWEAAKRECARVNPDPLTWKVPGHRVRLRIFSGASAGSMTSAIAAVALKYTFPHVQATLNDANPFNKAWVRDIDISKLTLTEDLKNPQTPVVSLLDSTPFVGILQGALHYVGGPAPPRPYRDPSVRFIFTQGNLRGIPYFLSLTSNAPAGLGMTAHADYQGFSLRYSVGVPGSTPTSSRADDIAVTFPNNHEDPNWTSLGTAALASGAFPIGLAPRQIKRSGAGFDYRFVVVPGTGATPAQVVQLRPRWQTSTAPIPSVLSSWTGGR